MADVSGGVPIIPNFGGDIAGTCEGECSVAPSIGAYVALRAGYELSAGFGFGLALGFLLAEQQVSGRPASLSPVDLSQPDGKSSASSAGTVKDVLAIQRGLLVGPWVGFSYGDKLSFHGRVAAGALFGWVSDSRTGTFDPVRQGPNYSVGPLSVTQFVPFIHVTPDLRVGYRFTDRFEVGIGLDVLLFIALGEPAWDSEKPINAGADGIGTFPSETLVGNVLFGVSPGVSARYDFF